MIFRAQMRRDPQRSFQSSSKVHLGNKVGLIFFLLLPFCGSFAPSAGLILNKQHWSSREKANTHTHTEENTHTITSTQTRVCACYSIILSLLSPPHSHYTWFVVCVKNRKEGTGRKRVLSDVMTRRTSEKRARTCRSRTESSRYLSIRVKWIHRPPDISGSLIYVFKVRV